MPMYTVWTTNTKALAGPHPLRTRLSIRLEVMMLSNHRHQIDIHKCGAALPLCKP